VLYDSAAPSAGQLLFTIPNGSLYPTCPQSILENKDLMMSNPARLMAFKEVPASIIFVETVGHLDVYQAGAIHASKWSTGGGQMHHYGTGP
jgi:hypothetical protein